MSETQVDSEAKPNMKRTLVTYVKYAAGLLLLLVLGLVMIIVVRFRNDAKIPYTVSTEGITIPKFSELEIDFAHHYEQPTAIQTAAGAIINVDNHLLAARTPVVGYLIGPWHRGQMLLYPLCQLKNFVCITPVNANCHRWPCR